MLKPLTQLRGLAVALSITANLFAASHAAAAPSASCVALIKATLPHPDRPYRAVNTMMIDGKTMTNEGVYIGGYIYTREGEGKWRRTKNTIDVKAVEKIALETTLDCAVTGTDRLDGKAMTVWTSKVAAPFDKSVITSQTWIDASDGRVYRQRSKDVETRIFYDNVVAPEVEPPRKKR